MDIKRFVTDDVREGMLSVRSLLGPDAVILSNRRIGNRIEILATNEFDAESIDVRTPKKRRAEVEVSDFGDSAIRDKNKGLSAPLQTMGSVTNAEVDLDAAALQGRQTDQYQSFTPQPLVSSSAELVTTSTELSNQTRQNGSLSSTEEMPGYQSGADKIESSSPSLAATLEASNHAVSLESSPQIDGAEEQRAENEPGHGIVGLWRAARQSLRTNRTEQANAETSDASVEPSGQASAENDKASYDNEPRGDVGRAANESAGIAKSMEQLPTGLVSATDPREKIENSAVNPIGNALPQASSEFSGHRQEAAVPLLGAAQRLTGLGQELGELKTLLRKELTRLRSLQGRELPFETHCKEVLIEMGFSAQAIEQVIEALTDEEEALGASLAEDTSIGACQRVHSALARSIRSFDRDMIGAGGVYSMIGASGVGKTTTVAKLAARYSLLHGRSSIGLITTDAFKIGGQDQLATFGKLLGITVHAAHDEDQLTDALKRNMDKQLVLIDSAGMSARDVRMNRHLARIKMHGTFAKNILIASATSQPGLADVVLEEYAHASVHGAVLTKVDEAVNLGPGLSTLVQKAVPLAYSCDGQGLADIQVAHVTSLLKEAFTRVREARDIEFESHEVQQQHA